MMDTAASYWNSFPSKLFGCCQDSRRFDDEGENIDENKIEIESNFDVEVKKVNYLGSE